MTVRRMVPFVRNVPEPPICNVPVKPVLLPVKLAVCPPAVPEMFGFTITVPVPTIGAAKVSVEAFALATKSVPSRFTVMVLPAAMMVATPSNSSVPAVTVVAPV